MKAPHTKKSAQYAALNVYRVVFNTLHEYELYLLWLAALFQQTGGKKIRLSAQLENLNRISKGSWGSGSL
jgi:hypothetical protein